MFLVLNVVCCLVSSYFYAYIAAFHVPKFGDPLFTVMLCFESVFLIKMITRFFVSFTKDGQTIPTRDLNQIAKRYVKSIDFFFDAITIFPFSFILDLNGIENHLFVIKCIRVGIGFRLFNLRRIMSDIRSFQSNRLSRIISNDPIAAEDTISDQNKITRIIMVNFFLRIFKLGMVIVHVCYFLGLFWIIFCEIS